MGWEWFENGDERPYRDRSRPLTNGIGQVRGLLDEDGPPEDWFEELEQLIRRGRPLAPRSERTRKE